MKKYLTTLLATFIIALTFSGCGDNLFWSGYDSSLMRVYEAWAFETSLDSVRIYVDDVFRMGGRSYLISDGTIISYYNSYS